MINKSIIDSQNVDIEQLLAPEGRLLGSAPNLTLAEGALAYNLTDDRLYICDGAVYKDVSAQSNIAMATFGSTANAEGATVTSPAGANQSLQLQPASGTFPGGVSTAEQFFSGIKCFNNGVRMFNLSDPLMSPFYNSPSYFTQEQVTSGTLPLLVLSAGGASTTVNWHIQKVGRIIHVSIGTSTAVTLTTPNMIGATLPADYRPLTVERSAPLYMIENGVRVLGSVRIATTGIMSFFSNDAGTVGFTGVAGTSDTTFTFTN